MQFVLSLFSIEILSNDEIHQLKELMNDRVVSETLE